MPDLPGEPSLQQLRYQARDLQRAVRRGDQDALAEVAGFHPAGRSDGAAAAAFPLSAAQLVVARRYGFPSWDRLRRYVEVVERYSRVNARGRSDAPESHPWQTALHVAAMDGRLHLARSLFGLGADPGIRDQRFDSTPLGWARYFGQEQLVALLEPLTAAEEP
jgi:hypothetical protein